jgi:hypothetical protein
VEVGRPPSLQFLDELLFLSHVRRLHSQRQAQLLPGVAMADPYGPPLSTAEGVWLAKVTEAPDGAEL